MGAKIYCWGGFSVLNIAIVDYKMGNIRSLEGALNHLGQEDVVVTSAYDTLFLADKIILPGVGSFACAMKEIYERNLDAKIKELVIDRKKPILGICLGMQLLTEGSSEDGQTKGLGLIPACVEEFDVSTDIVPHVGANQVTYTAESRLFAQLASGPDFYFTHSYRVQNLTDESVLIAECDYAGGFVAAFEKDHIAGVQFHPELSQCNGLKLLSNFLNAF